MLDQKLTRIMGRSQQPTKLQLQAYLNRIYLHAAWVFLPCKSERAKKIKTIQLWLLANTGHEFCLQFLQQDRHLQCIYNTYAWFKSPTDSKWIQNSPFMKLFIMSLPTVVKISYQELNICNLFLPFIFQLSLLSISLAVWDWMTWV